MHNGVSFSSPSNRGQPRIFHPPHLPQALFLPFPYPFPSPYFVQVCAYNSLKISGYLPSFAPLCGNKREKFAGQLSWIIPLLFPGGTSPPLSSLHSTGILNGKVRGGRSAVLSPSSFLQPGIGHLLNERITEILNRGN